MKKKQRPVIFYLVEVSLIAAVYASLTLALQPISYGALQFRVSEALTLLPVLTPAAIPGLTIGCAIANITSPLGVIDVLTGSAATLLSAIFTRMLKNVTIKKIPFLSALMPVIFNALIVGLVITVYLPEGFSFTAYLMMAASVGGCEMIVCFVLGLPLTAALQRTKIFEQTRW